MKIFMVGATGRTGKWILRAMLARGFQVTALVRPRADRPTPKAPGLTVVAGDLARLPDLKGFDAIVSALSSATVADGTRRLIAAAEAAGVGRFVGLAGGGILQLDADRLRRDRPDYPAMFKRSSEGHLAAWRALAASRLAWTLFCTPDLLDEPASGRAKSREDYMPEGGRSVPSGDVAELFADALANRSFVNQRVGVTC